MLTDEIGITTTIFNRETELIAYALRDVNSTKQEAVRLSFATISMNIDEHLNKQ